MPCTRARRTQGPREEGRSQDASHTPAATSSSSAASRPHILLCQPLNGHDGWPGVAHVASGGCQRGGGKSRRRRHMQRGDARSQKEITLLLSCYTVGDLMTLEIMSADDLMHRHWHDRHARVCTAASPRRPGPGRAAAALRSLGASCTLCLLIATCVPLMFVTNSKRKPIKDVALVGSSLPGRFRHEEYSSACHAVLYKSTMQNNQL